jgi:hypothetical protein
MGYMAQRSVEVMNEREARGFSPKADRQISRVCHLGETNCVKLSSHHIRRDFPVKQVRATFASLLRLRSTDPTRAARS